MNTPTSDDLKAMMRDLEQRKKALTKHFDEFELLQKEIQSLNQRATNGDVGSIRKITNLSNAFPNGFSQQQQQILGKAKEIEKNFKTIKNQFQEIEKNTKPLNNNRKKLEKNTNIQETDNAIITKPKRPKIKSFC
ncbi:hypothetical protein [uncultured Shewanella sp.]|uniref:hypothetical protein n=1 Tax=uncultured Shewanella sp. TaxID=173975 RepID=UPI00262366ED|nr:hypothetical protein [uncultured Shewanella sp.]